MFTGALPIDGLPIIQTSARVHGPEVEMYCARVVMARWTIGFRAEVTTLKVTTNNRLCSHLQSCIADTHKERG
jgi:hypothetical protein